MAGLTDRELLERAAKAAGLQGAWDESIGAFMLTDEAYMPTVWHPINDDAQALRLAIDARVCIIFGYCLDDAPIVQCGPEHDRFNFEVWPQRPNFPDPKAATRLAIVRAAASLATEGGV